MKRSPIERIPGKSLVASMLDSLTVRDRRASAATVGFALALGLAGIAAASTPARFRNVDILSDGHETVVEIEVEGPFSYTTFALESPHRFVIDLAGVKLDGSRAVTADGPTLERVRLAQYIAQPEPVTRLVLDLRQATAPIVEEVGTGLRVRFVRSRASEGGSEALDATTSAPLPDPLPDPQPSAVEAIPVDLVPIDEAWEPNTTNERETTLQVETPVDVSPDGGERAIDPTGSGALVPAEPLPRAVSGAPEALASAPGPDRITTPEPIVPASPPSGPTVAPTTGNAWLVLANGEQFETLGPWRLDGRRIVYTDLLGTLSSIRSAAVDLDASRRLTRSPPSAQTDDDAANDTAHVEPLEPILVLTDEVVGGYRQAEPEAGAATDPDLAAASSPAGGANSPASTAPATTSAVEVTTYQTVTSDENQAQVYGSLRNNGRVTARRVRVKVLLYDEAGTLLQSVDARVAQPSIAPGATSNFRAFLPPGFFSRVEFEVMDGL